MEKELALSEKEIIMFTEPKFKDVKSLKHKIYVWPMIKNLSDECERERFVSYYQMAPMIPDTVSSFEEADYIIYGHPYARVEDFTDDVLLEIEAINMLRKEGSELIIVGKATNIKPYIEGKYDNITYVPSHFTEYLGKRFEYDMKEQYFVIDDTKENEKTLNMWPVDGCLNKCAFCRRTYMHIPFESLSLDYIKEKLDWYKANHPEEMEIFQIRAENLTEYGIDIYGKPMLHKLIDLVDSYDEIKELRLPIGMNIGEINDDILESLCKSKKLKVIGLNLEAGSNRLLKLINKSHTREDAIRIYKTLRQYHPMLFITSTIMIGLPTEGLEDILELGNLINEVEPNYVLSNYYGFSPKHPIAKYPQVNDKVREQHQDFLLKVLKSKTDRFAFLEVDYEAPFKKNKRSHERKKREIEKDNEESIPRIYFQKIKWFCDDEITLNGDFSWDAYYKKKKARNRNF